MNGPRKRRPSKAARNERRKAFATTLNALSVAFFAAGLVQPLVNDRWSIRAVGLALGLFVALQGALHYVLQRLED